MNRVTNLLNPINEKAILIFGFQKSGTTVIASLIAEMSGESSTIDTHFLWEPYLTQLIDKKIGFEDHIKRNSLPFSKSIIKEPNLLFFTEDLQQLFEMNKYVFIVRNPFDNIRSILNRLKIEGNRKEIDIEEVIKPWRPFFSERKKGNYVEKLAHHWVAFNSNNLNSNNGRCVSLKYEDFQNDKVGEIERVVNALGLKKVNSIDHLIDKQFQPKGNSSIDVRSFFGEDNYQKIKDICQPLSEKLGYSYE